MAFIRHLQSLKLSPFISQLLRFQKKPPVGLYSLHVISLKEELEFPRRLPKELRYALQKDPSLINRIERIFKSGKAIGIRTIEKTPERVLNAINNIAILSQHQTIITWLPRLLLTQTRPVFLPYDHERSEKSGVDLDEEVAVILAHRLDFKKFILVDDGNLGATEVDNKLIGELNEAISPIILRHVTSRMIFDNADTRTATGQAIIKALLLVGPITHVLELYTRGFGKLVAASTDDVLAETAELFALRGSGFTWKQLIVRSRLLIPVFALATYGAFQVDHLIDKGDLSWAGFLFGVTSVALSLTTAVQSIRMYEQCVNDLVKEGKLSLPNNFRHWIVAVKQDFTNPARLGLFIGGILSPIISMTVFAWFPQFVHNGWILAMLGTAETVTAGTVVILARRLNALKFQLDVNRFLREQVREHRRGGEE